jgi:hypothetical protein
MFDDITASLMASHRKQARKRGRIVYDCMNAKVRGDRVYCDRGNRLHATSKSGDMALHHVLRGAKVAVCQKCENYEQGDSEDDGCAGADHQGGP